MRDKVGSFASASNVESYLQRWVDQYVTADDSASQETKAQFPAARSIGRGRGDCRAARRLSGGLPIRPHFQLDELSVSLRLVAELPQGTKAIDHRSRQAMKDIYIEFKGSDIKGDSRDQSTRTPSRVYSWSHLIRQPKSATASSLVGTPPSAARTCRDGVLKGHRRRKPQALAGLLIRYRGHDVVVYFYRAFGGKNNTGSPSSSQNRHPVPENRAQERDRCVGGADRLEQGIPQETFTLKRYSAVKWTYDELNIDGAASPGKVNIQGAWNLAKNTANLT